MTGKVCKHIQQGHRYRHGDKEVLALESGRAAKVAEIEPGDLWLGRKYGARSEWLQALPMRYFHGEVPR